MKLKTLPLLVIFLFVVACSPQVTVTPEATVTSTPPPTSTPIPTPTLHPEFIALQEQIAASGGRYTLQVDGTIWDNVSAAPVQGLRVDNNGVMTMIVGDEPIPIESGSIKFTSDGVEIDGYELDEDGEWVEVQVVEPVKEFPVCKFVEFQQCNIPLEEVQEHGRYAQSLLDENTFNPEKLKFVAEYEKLSGTGNTLLVPDVDTVPNYPDPETAPFVKDFLAGITEVDGVPHAVVQVPYYVEGVEPEKLPVMTGLRPLRADLKGNWPIVAQVFDENMNVIPWRIDSESIEMAMRFINPATGEHFTSAEVREIVSMMERGDFSRTNGLVLLFHIAKNDGGWYE
jgi:hypothetical protein